MTYAKTDYFDRDLREVARFARVLSHPARLAILRHLAGCPSCRSGDIAEELPLSRTTVSQHLLELQNAGLLLHYTDRNRVYYKVDVYRLKRLREQMERYFNVTLCNLTSGDQNPKWDDGSEAID
ncbi:MAG: winged helix-turn-helix transcriptional regulator [Bacteroidales bacterium]|nr:winged helix-turn-helix transcriptional regulator [Bacteroidales bacterium]